MTGERDGGEEGPGEVMRGTKLSRGGMISGRELRGENALGG